MGLHRIQLGPQHVRTAARPLMLRGASARGPLTFFKQTRDDDRIA